MTALNLAGMSVWPARRIAPEVAMPKILDRVVRQLLAAKGVANPYAVGVSAMQKAGNLKKGTLQATKQGVKRGNMTPAAREQARRARAK